MKTINTITISIALLLAAGSASALQRNGERPPPRPEFSSLDANADGLIEWDEFATQELPHGTPDEAFQSMDTDQDGFVSEQEYADHKPPHPSRD